MTISEMTQIVNQVVDKIKTESQSVNELEIVSSLTGVNSLPAMQGTKLVSAPVSLLSKPATDAAAKANAAATTATNAATNANKSAEAAQAARQEAINATGNAIAAADYARETAENISGFTALYHATIVNANRLLDWESPFKDLSQVLTGVRVNSVDTVQKDGVIFVYLTNKGWECKQFSGDPATDFSNLKNWADFGGSGSGSGFYNITQLHPLTSGYYTKQKAVAALANAEIEDEHKAGMIITYETSAGKWEDYRFSGTVSDFLNPASWVEFGVKDVVKSVTFNGRKITPDAEGNISLAVDIPDIDETLDAESTNPVQNKAIKAKLDEVEAATVFGMNAEVDEETNVVKLILTNKSGAEIASTEYQGGTGSGSGGESASSTRVILNAGIDNTIIKEGGTSSLTYFFDHQYANGDDKGTSTGQKAEVTITIKLGSQTVYTQTLVDISKGTYTFDLTKYLLLGTSDIYVKATVKDIEGKVQSKQAYASVRVVTLSLASSYSLASQISGYESTASVDIPFTISGTGTKIVNLYIDGIQKDSKTITKSGQTNGSFNLSMRDYTAGRHTVQMVAEMEASADLVIRSESIYFDIYKVGSNTPHIATKQRFPDGRIFTSDHLTPRIEVGQYEKMSFDFIVYHPGKTPADMSVYKDGVMTQSISIPRTTQVYTNRFTEQGSSMMKFVCNGRDYPFYIDVAKSNIDIEEIKSGQTLRLIASGRSNSEANPAAWEYDKIKTTFNGFDWNSNGWTGDALKITNGASIEIGYQPFSKDATTTGATYEIELKCSNVLDRNGIVIDCMSDGVGFQMTTQEALMKASGGTQVMTSFASDMDLKIAFVIQPKSGTRLMELFINGIRCGADQYAETESLLQSTPVSMKILSDSADVEIRNVRVYNRALTDDEELTNFMVDRPTTEEMVVLFNENDIMNDDGSSVDIDKLRAKGKSIMRVVGDVNLVNATNNKKFEVPADIYFYSAYGKEYDFIVRNAGLRIQGTSSTTYPRKNYRIYFDRYNKYGTTLEVNGVDVPDLTYSFKPGARPVKIWCMKADFSDSTSTHNTGAARLINDIWKKCGFLTPPQEAYTGEYDVRTAVDGFPCDMFYDNNNTNINVYLGKYNFNNEKSDSHTVYGFEGIEGFNDEAALNGKRNKCICLEFLNNSEALCLFGSSDMSGFDDALEFRFKADQTWDTAHEDDREAVRRLWTWVHSCRGNYTKFAAEADQYFNVNSLAAWYLYTDYFMAVDQRAKNMMLATWDGLLWYFLPYDSDTIFGDRNDCVLAYDYRITSETFDETIGSYAFAGHDSVLWDLVRGGLQNKLVEVAGVIRSNMSTEDVLKMFNEKQMGNWCERIYNKDGEYKYIKPLTEGVTTSDGTSYYNYLYALKGSAYAHRTFTIQNRFALMDAQYVAGTYRRDSFPVYFGYAFSKDPRKVKIVSSERYYFGYGYTSGTPTQSAVLAEDEGSPAELTLATDLIVNDPQYFYGASRMKELDLRDVSHAILQTLNLNNCATLQSLDISCPTTQRTLNNLLVSGCRNLQHLNMTGIQSESFANLDLSANTKLKTFKASRTSLLGVSFAKGAPLEAVTLPATLQSLELRSLNRLTNTGLVLEGVSNLTRLVIDNCALINWEELFDRCTAVKYLRVTGVDLEGDGALLRKLMRIGGVDENGGSSDTCRLVGSYKLTNYMSDEEYELVCRHFPELKITQPEYTMIEFDDTVTDDRNVSNLDNHTGLKFGNDYVPSAHINAILKQRFRCLGKQAVKDKMTICKLHDKNSYYYADADSLTDATPAKLDGSEGDVFMYEPKYWYKGINDYLNNKKYACFSSNKEMPSVPTGHKIIRLEEIQGTGMYVNNSKLLAGFLTVEDSYSQDTKYAVCKVNLETYKKVRFPSVLGLNGVSSIYVDLVGNVVKTVTIPTLNSKFENGMYLIDDVPDNAIYLYFTIEKTAEFDCIILSNTNKIEDMEPEWVEHKECLTGLFESTAIGTKIQSAITGSTSIASISFSDFEFYAKQRNLQLIDYEMSKDVANLFFARYGRRDSQNQCGYGLNTYNRVVGVSAHMGMLDTVNPNNAHENAWFEINNGGIITYAQTQNSICMGYENWFGNKTEWVSGVTIPNKNATEYFKWHINRTDGTIGIIKSVGNSAYYAGVHFQKFMDTLFVGTAVSNATTAYCDTSGTSSLPDRIVHRSGSTIGQGGGVSYYVATNDKYNISSMITCRLAFRKEIKQITEVNTFKKTATIY